MRSVYGVSILAGTVIGAGLFSLPYIATVVGIKLMFVYIIILGSISLLVHLLLGKVSLETPDFMRLPGFVKHHLGTKAQKVAYGSAVFGLLGAILAYTILGGEFLKSMMSSKFGGEVVIYTLLYFAFASYFIYFGIKAISKIQFIGILSFFVLLIGVLIHGWDSMSISNILYIREGTFDLFLPYGVILFAFCGTALIPEVEEVLKDDKNKLPKVITAGILISIIISVVFMLLVISITGENTTENALGGLNGVLGNGAVFLMLLFGVVATFTSIITMGLTLKKVIWYDLGLNKNIAWSITCLIPISLFLIGARDFIAVIGIVGAVMFAVDAILIFFMYEKIRSKKVRIITYPLIVVFVVGIIYELLYFLK